MHELHLLRHAKSSQDDGVDDRERALSRRGRDDARAIARHLAEAVGRVDLVLCSSALRTRETLELVMTGFSPRPSVQTEDALYLASPATLLRRLRRIKEACGTVMVIGHNPGLHELASLLCAPDCRTATNCSAASFRHWRGRVFGSRRTGRRSTPAATR